MGGRTTRSTAWHIASVLCCAVWLVLAAGCGTPVSVERLDDVAAHRQLTANALTAGELSTSARNILRRWALSERYDADPEGALAALHAIVVQGKGGADEVITLAEMAFLYAEKSQQRRYFVAATVYSYAFLFPEKGWEAPSPYDPRLRLAADLYSLGIVHGFASVDGTNVEFKSGEYDLPFGRLDLNVDPSAFELYNRRIVALSPEQNIEVHGLANRYRHAGIGAPLAATTQPMVADRGMQVAPRMKLPITAVLRLDAPRHQLTQTELRAELSLYNTFDTAATTIAGQRVPLEADQTATLAYVLASPELWERELKAFFSGVFSESTPTQLASIDAYRPGRIPVVFVHGTASSAGRWGDMVNDLLDDPRIREQFQFWFFTYDTGNPVLYSAALLRESLRAAVRKLDPRGTDPALREMVVIGHSQGGLLAKAMVIDTGDRVWNAIAYKPIDEINLSAEQRDLLRRTVFIKPMPNVRRVVFIATPHRGSFLTEYSVVRLLGRFLTLPLRLAKASIELAARNANDFKVDPRNLESGSLFGMTPNNPVLQVMAATPIAPGVHAHSIIAVEGDGPVAGSDDGVVKYQSSHLEGVDSEYIVRSGHSTQSNPYTIEEVRRILLLHARDVCTRIRCTDLPALPSGAHRDEFALMGAQGALVGRLRTHALAGPISGRLRRGDTSQPARDRTQQQSPAELVFAKEYAPCPQRPM
jgi:pimeloyl-ACP methyl ester carboxylesterase